MHPVSILHDARIQWLAAALRAECPTWSTDLGDTEGMLATACAEGVAPLVNHESNTRRGEWRLPAEFDQGLVAAMRAEVVSVAEESDVDSCGPPTVDLIRTRTAHG